MTKPTSFLRVSPQRRLPIGVPMEATLRIPRAALFTSQRTVSGYDAELIRMPNICSAEVVLALWVLEKAAALKGVGYCGELAPGGGQ